MNTNYHKGFTLIELLVVISIIAMLASIVLSSISIARNKAFDTTDISNVRQLDQAIQQYVYAKGTYPPQDYPNTPGGSGYNTQCQTTFLSALVSNKFLDSVPIDKNACPYVGGNPFIWYLNNDGNVGGVALNTVAQQGYVTQDCPDPTNTRAVLRFYLRTGPTPYYPIDYTNPYVNVICYK